MLFFFFQFTAILRCPNWVCQFTEILWVPRVCHFTEIIWYGLVVHYPHAGHHTDKLRISLPEIIIQIYNHALNTVSPKMIVTPKKCKVALFKSCILFFHELSRPWASKTCSCRHFHLVSAWLPQTSLFKIPSSKKLNFPHKIIYKM